LHSSAIDLNCSEISYDCSMLENFLSLVLSTMALDSFLFRLSSAGDRVTALVAPVRSLFLF
jgi:hypothetical protein